jgi:hypothetical protein
MAGRARAVEGIGVGAEEGEDGAAVGLVGRLARPGGEDVAAGLGQAPRSRWARIAGRPEAER